MIKKILTDKKELKISNIKIFKKIQKILTKRRDSRRQEKFKKILIKIVDSYR